MAMHEFKVNIKNPSSWFIPLVPLISLVMIAVGIIQNILPLVALALIGIGFFVVLTKYPEVSLMFVVAGFYYYPFIFDLLGIPLSSAASFAFWSVFSTSALIGFYGSSTRKFTDYLGNPIICLFLLLLFWHGVSWVVMSGFSDDATKRLGFAVFMMIMPFFTGLLMNRQQIERFLFVIMAAGVVGSFVATFRYLTGDFNQTLRFSISESAGVLQFIYSLGTGLIVLLSWTFVKSEWKKWLFVTAQYILVYSLVFAAGSRGPLLIVSAATLTLLFLSSEWAIRIRLIIVIFFASLAIAAVLPFLPPNAIERVGWLFAWLSDISVSTDSNSLRLASGGRAEIWAQSFQFWTQSPWFGIGLAGTESSSFAGFAHNFILEIMVELGLVGLAIFTCYIFFIGQHSVYIYRTYINSYTVRTTLVLFLYSIMMLMISGRLQASPLFWLSCGLILSLSTTLSNETAVYSGPHCQERKAFKSVKFL